MEANLLTQVRTLNRVGRIEFKTESVSRMKNSAAIGPTWQRRRLSEKRVTKGDAEANGWDQALLHVEREEESWTTQVGPEVE